MTARNRQLVRLVEIAAMGGVSRQRAEQWARRPDFPEPVQRWHRGRIWFADEVQRWLEKPRPPHRPPGSSGVRARSLGLHREGPGRYLSTDGTIEIMGRRSGWLVADRTSNWSIEARSFEAAKEELAAYITGRRLKGGSDVR